MTRTGHSRHTSAPELRPDLAAPGIRAAERERRGHSNHFLGRNFAHEDTPSAIANGQGLGSLLLALVWKLAIPGLVSRQMQLKHTCFSNGSSGLGQSAVLWVPLQLAQRGSPVRGKWEDEP